MQQISYSGLINLNIIDLRDKSILKKKKNNLTKFEFSPLKIVSFQMSRQYQLCSVANFINYFPFFFKCAEKYFESFWIKKLRLNTS